MIDWIKLTDRVPDGKGWYELYNDDNAILLYVENSEQASFESKVSGTEQGYYTNDVGTGNWEDMQPLGKKRGWVAGSARVRLI